MPVTCTMSSKNASAGMVYRKAENSENGVSNQPWRCANSAAASAITTPTPIAMAVSSMCSTRRGAKREPKLSTNQAPQNCPFFATHDWLPPPPKVGMTGPGLGDGVLPKGASTLTARAPAAPGSAVGTQHGGDPLQAHAAHDRPVLAGHGDAGGSLGEHERERVAQCGPRWGG